MAAQAPMRSAWRNAHRAARRAYPRSPETRPYVEADAFRELGSALRPAGRASGTVAAFLTFAAEARRDGRPDGARVWLSLAHSRNQLGD